MITKEVVYPSGETRILFWCSGCQCNHQIRSKSATDKNQDCWGFNGNFDKPTFTPSVLTEGGSRNIRCHIFVNDGVINYLNDCGHDLRGMVPMVDIPNI